jgi:hypothetical protein
VRAGTHSLKARLCGNILAINVEQYSGGGDGTAGLAFFDIGDPRHPLETAYYRMGGLSTGGTGVHRFQMDCERKLLYASGSADGFQGNFVLIIDISNPYKPREVGHYIPRPEQGVPFIQSYDVFVDQRGLIYLIHPVKGLDILRHRMASD